MKPKFPIIVRRGSVNVKIYFQPSAHIFTLAYYEGGARQRPSFADLETAREQANAVADRLARGDAGQLVLRDGERREYVRAKECLAPIGTPLDIAANEYSQAVSILKGKVSLLEAVRNYATSQAADMVPIRTADLVADLLKAREANHSSSRHIQDLRSRLGRFARAFQCDVHTIRPAHVQDFLLSLKLSPRSLNNYRGAISNLFGHAKLRGHVPKDFDPVTDIPWAKEAENEVEIYTADEMFTMLRYAKQEMVPYVALAAFAGLRQAELARLEWNDVRTDHILIKGGISKTKTKRQVPIVPNLAAWLEPFRGQSGRVVRFAFVSSQLCKLTRKAGLTSRPNGLRHSFGSYRVAWIKDPAVVAYEMGNTPGMVFKHYRRVVGEAEAKRWFAIFPDRERQPVFKLAEPPELGVMAKTA